MFRIGCHLSCADGYRAMGENAVKIGANTFQFFTRNPRGGSAKPLDEADVSAFLDLAADHDLQRMVAHAPYIFNACAADPHLREFARDLMSDDLQRLEYTPNCYYNFHPGSHVKQGVDVGITYIAELLNGILWKEQSTVVLLETMAGKGTEVGRSFEELKEILDRVECSSKVGICLDTCHVYDAGYDIVNDLDGVLTHFDNVIGLDRLKAIHLNDSMYGFESHKDRHAKIGEGAIGLEAIVRIINHPALRDLPFDLETPNDLDGYAREIELLKSYYRN